jgi:uncharacterized phage protein gp47/JayE
VAYDPESNVVYESAANGPFRCSFVDLRKAAPNDFPYLQNKEDIAGRMISEVLNIYPDLDLTPRSELRDLIIDPVSLELSEMSTREWFARCSNSVSAMAQVDDSDGDGFSDPFSASTVKQKLASAWHLDFTSMQALIDKQFDLIGERAGISRGGSTPAISQLTIYTYVKPQSRVSISSGAVVVTVPDAETPTVQFIVVGSAMMDPNSLDSHFDSAKGWWAVNVPVQCDQSGSIGNVGAGTIRQVVSGIPAGFSVTNLIGADYGQDQESNSKYAERIQDRLVVGVDSGTRRGYLGTARAIPGVTEARVVASGDLEMLRDWDHAQRKHIFGTVDIYVRGLSVGQNEVQTPYQYANYAPHGEFNKYLALSRNGNVLRYVQELPATPVNVMEVVLLSTATNTVYYLGVDNAALDPATKAIFIDPTELSYQYTGSGATLLKTPAILPGATLPATNLQILNYLRTANLRCNLRLEAPLSLAPLLQPVISVGSVVGEESFTGTIPTSDVRLIKDQDPLLLGGSNLSNDEIRIDFDKTSLQEKVMLFLSNGSLIQNIDQHMILSVFSDGTVSDVVSVRSEDKLTRYIYGQDYTLKSQGPYGGFALVRTQNSRIPLADPDDTNGKHILVNYLRKSYTEHLVFVQNEAVVLEGSSPSYLAHAGFVKNTWLPESYGNTTLSLDGYSTDPDLITGLYGALIPRELRYIKVVLKSGGVDVVMKEDADFVLSVDSLTGQATITRKLTGRIGSGSQVLVSYFANEVFTIATQYPQFVQQVGSKVETTRHAAADVVVKAMTENHVDITLTVELAPNASPETLDSRIRTTITKVLDQTRDKLTQSEVIRQVKSLNGISNIQVPLFKFAKSDGSYDIGCLIPTNTKWNPIESESRITSLLANFPSKTFISQSTLLPNRTLPSGGLKDAYVGLLYEGFAFKRCGSLTELSKALEASFYIIGYNDTIDGSTPFLTSDEGRIVLNLPNTGTQADDGMTDPALYSFRVTYQVWSEGGYQDILLSPSEYLRPGRIAIDFVTPKKSANIL